MVKRSKLPQYNTLKDVTKLLHDSKNIIVLTGAGVSISLPVTYITNPPLDLNIPRDS